MRVFKHVLLHLALALSLCILSFVGVNNMAMCDASEMTARQRIKLTQQAFVYLADSGDSRAPNEKKSKRQKENKASQPPSELKTGSGGKVTPRKDFAPSEKIKTEQAVDFPADI
jgi:hypothetical protein